MRFLKVRQFCRDELTGRKLLFWIVWYTAHLGAFAYGWWSQATNQRLALLNTLKFSVWTSRGAGLVLALDGSLILLPVLRNLLCYIRPKMRKLPLDENIWFHKQVAYSMAFWAMIHTTAHYVNFYNVEATQARPVKAWQIHYTQVGGVTGHIMLLCMALMYTTAQIKIRVQCFEAFWYTHHLAFIFMAALYSHASGCFVRDTPLPYSPFTQMNQFWDHCIGYQSFRWETIFGVAYLCERVYREIRARRATTLTKVLVHPKGVLELQFKKPSMKYLPGQYLLLNVPALSKWQYHPFTISSCPHDDYVSVHIRQVGDWTNALGDLCASTLPDIRVDGPYGCPAEDISQNQIALICGAGIGITPWASILKNLYHMRLNNTLSKLVKLELIWICRDVRDFAWFQELLANLELPCDKSGRVQLQVTSPRRDDFLKLNIYLTGRLTLDEINNYLINDSRNDGFTRLHTKTNFGRPDFHRLLSDIKGRIETGVYVPDMQDQKVTRVGFYFCGPSALGTSIQRTCKGVSSKGVKFEFHKEQF